MKRQRQKFTLPLQARFNLFRFVVLAETKTKKQINKSSIFHFRATNKVCKTDSNS